jgi:hypothetical protein
MKKAFVFLVLLAGFVGGLAAQTSVSDFYIIEASHIFTEPTCTLEAASAGASSFYASASNNLQERGLYTPLSFIQEKTRMEEQLVSRARRELPDNPSAGSMWLVLMGGPSSIRHVFYYILFFKSRDGQVYHWMYRCYGR